MFFLGLFVYNAKSQADSIKLIGKWKVVKIQFSKNVVFDLDDLTTAYKQFFERQKHTYNDSLSKNDSLFIQYTFEKTVNDINRMFIDFRTGNHYETNGFNKDGSPSEKKVGGIYNFNPENMEVSTLLNGNKNRLIKYTVTLLNDNWLVMNDTEEANPLIMTFKKSLK